MRTKIDSKAKTYVQGGQVHPWGRPEFELYNSGWLAETVTKKPPPADLKPDERELWDLGAKDGAAHLRKYLQAKADAEAKGASRAS